MRKWKYYFAVVILSMLFTQSPILASAGDDPVSLRVNDEPITDTNAYNYNDITYIPFRAVFEALDIPFRYDKSTQSISYTFQEELYSIDIQQEIIFTPDGGYKLLIPLLTIHQQIYIPLQYVEDLLKIEAHYIEEIKYLWVNSLDYAHDETINFLAKQYYLGDMPAKLLFTYDANPYGTLDDLYVAPDPAITQVINTKIGTIKYHSTTEAVVTTSQLSTTKAVTINRERQLHFRKQEGMWKISKISPTHLQIEMLDDVEEKVATLLQNSPNEVEKVLSDLRANYDALKGNDVKAAINAYSPLFIDDWNLRSNYNTWEEKVEHAIIFPSSQIDLLESKVIHIDDKIAAVYVKELYTELPQTYNGLYEPKELEEPYEYEKVLYLDHTDGKRWTFYTSDPLNSNY